MKTSLGTKTLAQPTPVWVVCAYDAAGKATGATIAWGGIVSSEPASLGISLRPSRYTYGCIMDKRAFTVNIPSVDQLSEADYFGMVSGKNVDKFAAANLTAQASQLVDAPFIAEFPLILECRLSKTVELGIHTQFIGEIADVKADPSCLDEKGNLNMELVRPFAFDPGTRGYYCMGPKAGQGFASGKIYL